MRRRLAIAAGATAAVAIACAAACTVADGLSLPSATPDAGLADTAVDAPTVDAGCVTAHIPPPPAADVDGDGVEYVFALRELDFRVDPALGNAGFDLDQACTCRPDKDTCRVAAAQPHCDGENGRDNALAELSQSITLPESLDPERFVKRELAAGRAGLLIKVAGYNGQADDRSVKVSFYPSNGTETARDGGPPTFTKTDRWTVDPGYLFGDPSLRIASLLSTKAYVSGRTLVALFSFKFPIAGLDVDLASGAFVATLVDGPPRLEHGVIVGRWALDKAVHALGQLDVDGSAACTLPFFPGVAPRVCQIADLRVNPAEDGRDLACDAISVGIGFSANEATIGGLDYIPPHENCPDAGVVNCQ
ncbi:MAG: hypothetical protein U0235_09875 [Polyangiaceae bacterium]